MARRILLAGLVGLLAMRSILALVEVQPSVAALVTKSQNSTAGLRKTPEECYQDLSDFIITVIASPESMSKDQQFWFSQSGKTINDMGKASTCQKNKNTSKYSVLKTVKQDLMFKVSYGYCGEPDCSPQVLTQMIQQKPKFKSAVQKYLSNNTGYSEADYDFEFIEQKDHKLDFLGVIVLIFMSMLLVPSLWSCTLYMFSERGSKKEVRSENMKESKLDTEVKQTVKRFTDVFNFKRNINMVFDYSVSKTRPYIRTLDGIKFLMLVAMVFCFEIQWRYGFSMNFSNKDHWKFTLTSDLLQAFMGGHFLPDMFLLIGGIGATMGMIHYFELDFDNKNHSGRVFIKAIVHKLFRFMPLYVLMMLYYWKLLPNLANGPNGHLVDEYVSNCKDHMWADVLLIGIFVYPNAQCMDWTWYLQVDFHCFLVLGLLCFVAYKYKLGHFVLQILFGIAAVIPIILAAIFFFAFKLKLESPYSDPKDMLDYRKWYSRSSLTRSSSYFIGAIFGLYYYLKETSRRKFEENNSDFESIINSVKSPQNKGKEVRVPGVWQFSFMRGYIWPSLGLLGIALSSSLYADYLESKNDWSSGLQCLFNIGSRLLVCLSMFLLIVPEITKTSGSVFNLILGSKIWIQFTKLALSFFFVQGMFIQWGVAAELNSQLYDWFLISNYGFGDFYISLFLSALLSVYYETPFRKLGTWLNNTFI